MRRPLRHAFAPVLSLAPLVVTGSLATVLAWSPPVAAARSSVSPDHHPDLRPALPATLSFLPRPTWTDTGVHVDGTRAVAMTATGSVRGLSGRGRPAGTGATCPGREARRVPSPALPCRSLVARIGDGAPFEVGPGTALRPAAGELRLAVNAVTAARSGRWTVHVGPGHLSPAYVALGDSYASGLGSHSYLAGSGSTTTTTSGSAAAAGCYRARDGYVEQLAGTTGDSLDFAACSGATIADLVDGPGAQTAALGLDTRLVTLSVGGNDVGFSSVLTSCIIGVGSPGRSGCATRDQAAVSTALGWLEHGRPAGPVTLPGMDASGRPVTHTSATALPSLTTLYETLGRLAPNAHLLVVGYPLLLESAVVRGGQPTTDCRVGTALGVSHYRIAAGDVAWLDRETDTLDDVIAAAVTRARTAGTDVTFVDPRPSLAGAGLCDTGTSDVNPLGFAGLEVWHLQPESFHPTAAGQDVLAGLLEREVIPAR